MRCYLLILLCIVAVLFVLSGCGRQTYCRANAVHLPEYDPIILPFNDGIFMLTPLDFDESRSASVGFSNEHFDNFCRRSGTTMGVHVQSFNFHLHAGGFINIMNGISPVLVDSVTTTGARRTDTPPFRGLRHANVL